MLHPLLQAEQQKPAEKLRKTEGASVNGDITLYYPSGQIAVVVTRSLEMGFRMVYLGADFFYWWPSFLLRGTCIARNCTYVIAISS